MRRAPSEMANRSHRNKDNDSSSSSDDEDEDVGDATAPVAGANLAAEECGWTSYNGTWYIVPCIVPQNMHSRGRLEFRGRRVFVAHKQPACCGDRSWGIGRAALGYLLAANAERT